MKKNILILFLSLLLIAFTNNVVVAEENDDDESFNQTVTVSVATVDDGVGEMLKEVDLFNDRRGLRTKKGTKGTRTKGTKGTKGDKYTTKYYEWRRIANTHKTGRSSVCSKCEAQETCDSEYDLTANLLEEWIRNNKDLSCHCSTTSTTAVGEPGSTKTCNDHNDCECECTAYCDFSLKCECIVG